MFITSCSGSRNLEAIIYPATTAPPPRMGEADIEFCSLEPQKISDRLRVVFAIDVTGSNRSTACVDQGCPTDPDKLLRYPSLINYIQGRKSLPNFNPENEKYAIYQFSSQQNIWNGGAIDGPDDDLFQDLDTFEQTVQQQQGVVDNGGTPYSQTLRNIAAQVKREALKAKEEYEEKRKTDPSAEIECHDVVTVFVSDGYPQPPEAILEIENSVEEILKLESDIDVGPFICGVTVNSGFYNSIELDPAIDRLKAIAKKGRGTFFNFLNEAIDYNKITEVNVSQIPVVFSHIFVLNESIIWDKKAQRYAADLDSDRMADINELPQCVPTLSEVKTLPYRNQYSDCDLNDLMDGFEAWISPDQKQCKDENCDPVNAARATCKVDGKVLDSDQDGLLDCLEARVDSQEESFDSYQSDVPDPIKYRHFYKMSKDSQQQVPISLTQRDTDGDGIKDYDEIKFNTPWDVQNQFLGEIVKPFLYNQVGFTPKEKRTCYTYEIRQITLASPEDLISVYITDEELIKPGRKAYRVIKKRMTDKRVKFTIEEFDAPDALKSIR